MKRISLVEQMPVGSKWGRLTIVEHIPAFGRGAKRLCRATCECGSLLEQVYMKHLKNGHTKSCGCYAAECALNNRSVEIGDKLGHFEIQKIVNRKTVEACCLICDVKKNTSIGALKKGQVGCSCITTEKRGAALRRVHAKTQEAKRNLIVECLKNGLTSREIAKIAKTSRCKIAAIRKEAGLTHCRIGAQRDVIAKMLKSGATLKIIKKVAKTSQKTIVSVREEIELVAGSTRIKRKTERQEAIKTMIKEGVRDMLIKNRLRTTSKTIKKYRAEMEKESRANLQKF